MSRARPALVIGAVVTVLAAGLGAVATVTYQAALRSNTGRLGFTTPLRIPPVLDAATGAFDLHVAAGQAELVPPAVTGTWGVNGPYLGPTLRARAGDGVVARVTNHLGEPTTMHWHGMHLPATEDGGPHQVIVPGQTWTAAWSVVQPSATLWYHAHPLDRTGDQVYRGIAGLFLLDDPATDPSALPHRYGVDDIPLILQDKRFADGGALDLDSPRFSPIGLLGDTVLVNGTYDPYLEVSTTRVRLRVLNASNARTYNLGFTDERAFSVIAGDAGFLAQPHETRRLLLAPSERAELVVEMRPGDDTVLRSHPTRLDAGRFPRRFAGGDDTLDLVRVRAGPALERSEALPGRLPSPEPTVAGPGDGRRVFEFNHASRINGRSHDPARVDFSVRPGQVERWELRNRSDNQHVFHVHGVSFTVVEVDGRPPPAALRGPKDSVFLPRGTTAVIDVRSPRWADAQHPYMFHCHVLAHEDHGMMGQFTVTTA